MKYDSDVRLLVRARVFAFRLVDGAMAMSVRTGSLSFTQVGATPYADGTLISESVEVFKHIPGGGSSGMQIGEPMFDETTIG